MTSSFRAGAPPLHHRPFSDSSYLAPEDAFSSPEKRERSVRGSIDSNVSGVSNGPMTAPLRPAGGNINALQHRHRRREKDGGRSRSRRRKSGWKKLLWVKQAYPDNYTDQTTFLSHLQRNPRLQLYDFWPLVADSTVIVQHLCSVAIFVCCFVGIFQERVYPISVVGWGSAGTVLGWFFWDLWVGQEEKQAARVAVARENAIALAKATAPSSVVGDGDEVGSSVGSGESNDGASTSGNKNALRDTPSPTAGLGLSLSTSNLPSKIHSRNTSSNSLPSPSAAPTPVMTGHPTGAPSFASYQTVPPYNAPASLFSPRNQQRLSTAKSAILIYCALLGLSPILKSLTRSTSEDSIWALSTWLMGINVFFFDYGGGVGAKFPASLSTNAALMSSTVLASRLPSTTHVFSLTLFSIEVFGLFPVFRRHLRHRSWRLHVLLTFLLIIAAGTVMGLTLSPEAKGAKAFGAVFWGVSLWGGASILGMGGCSWWLIRLQRYKDVVIGPWDPARPIIKGGAWE